METKKIVSLRKTLSLFIFRLVFPLCTIYLILIVPNSTERTFLSNSILHDWIVRIILTVFFCTNYWYLPQIFEPGSKTWLWVSKTVLHNPILLNRYYLLMTIGYGLFVFWFTYYTFSSFLPTLTNYRFLAAGLNGMIFVIVFALRYRAFMEFASSQIENELH